MEEGTKQLTDLVKCLESFYETNTNGQLILSMMSCRVIFSACPVPYLSPQPPKIRETHTGEDCEGTQVGGLSSGLDQQTMSRIRDPEREGKDHQLPLFQGSGISEPERIPVGSLLETLR